MDEPQGSGFKQRLNPAGLPSCCQGWRTISVPAVYDVSKKISIQGVVTKTEWANPHAHFWVDAKNDDGTISSGEMELPAPNALKKEEGGKLDFVKQALEVARSHRRSSPGIPTDRCGVVTHARPAYRSSWDDKPCLRHPGSSGCAPDAFGVNRFWSVRSSSQSRPPWRNSSPFP